MTLTTFQLLHLLKTKWQTLVTFAVVGLFVGLALSMVIPVRFRSSMELLVVQRYAFARDAYTASKSIEYLSNVFAEVMYSQSFINEVLGAGFPIQENFPPSAEKAKKQWKRMVKSRIGRDTGTISVAVYHRNPQQAKIIADAIQYVMANKADQYHGEGDRVVVRILDAPQVPATPVQPNVPVNALAGALVAVVAAVSLILSGRDVELTPAMIVDALKPNPTETAYTTAYAMAPAPETRETIAQWLEQ